MAYKNSELCEDLKKAANPEGFEVSKRESNTDLQDRYLQEELKLAETIVPKKGLDKETAAYVAFTIG